MNKKEYQLFLKRFDKYKKNNLPTFHWDDERFTSEWVWFDNDKVNTAYDLTDALSRMVCDNFYYSFTACHVTMRYENGKEIYEPVIGHCHEHTFEEVVRALYDSPESFSISKDEEEFYSKQELRLLKRIQKYLLFIGMKDLKTKRTITRFRSKKYDKYKDYIITNFSNQLIDKILSNKRNYIVRKKREYNSGSKIYEPKECRYLVSDEDDNIRFLIEMTKREEKKYKDVDQSINFDDVKQDDLVVVEYFKIIEKY